jgi:poly(3-hydroxybutyrate) depolymerase
MNHASIVSRLGAIAALLCTLLASVCAADAPDVRKESFEYAGIKRTFYLYAPESPAGPAPLLIVLHGSYGDGRSILSTWTTLATQEGLLVVGPDARDRTAWQIRADGPAYIHQLVDAVERRHPIDRQRLYLFGHSGGAVYALTLSMIESEFFAATAVHAGAWRTNKEFIAVPYARRKIPIEIFLGDKDEFFPVSAARKTQSALAEAGHDARLTIVPNHTHDYGKVADQVNREAWDFLKTTTLSRAAASPASLTGGDSK